MIKIDTLKYELLKLETQAGKYRQLFFLCSFFIYWSMLALFSSFNHPFQALTNFVPPLSLPTSTLAEDLINEFLSKYFSIFALFYLGLFLLYFIGSFKLVRDILILIQNLYRKDSATNFLLLRGFSLSAIPTVELTNQKEEVDDVFKLISSIGGPAKIKSQPGDLLLLQTLNRDFSLTRIPNDSPYLLKFYERVVGFFLLSENIIDASTHAISSDGRKVFVNRMQFSIMPNASLTYPLILLEKNNPFSIHSHLYLNSNFKAVIIHEIKSLLLNYSSDEISGLFQQSKKFKQKNAPSFRKHNMTFYRKLFAPQIKNIHQSEKKPFFRNRTRSLLPELHTSSAIENKSNLQNHIRFFEELTDHCTQSINLSFGLKVFDLKINNLGEATIHDRN